MNMNNYFNINNDLFESDIANDAFSNIDDKDTEYFKFDDLIDEGTAERSTSKKADIAKALLGIGASGALGAGGYGLYDYLSKHNSNKQSDAPSESKTPPSSDAPSESNPASFQQSLGDKLSQAADDTKAANDDVPPEATAGLTTNLNGMVNPNTIPDTVSGYHKFAGSVENALDSAGKTLRGYVGSGIDTLRGIDYAGELKKMPETLKLAADDTKTAIDSIPPEATGGVTTDLNGMVNPNTIPDTVSGYHEFANSVGGALDGAGKYMRDVFSNLGPTSRRALEDAQMASDNTKFETDGVPPEATGGVTTDLNGMVTPSTIPDAMGNYRDFANSVGDAYYSIRNRIGGAVDDIKNSSFGQYLRNLYNRPGESSQDGIPPLQDPSSFTSEYDRYME